MIITPELKDYFRFNPIPWIQMFLEVDPWFKQIDALNNIARKARTTIRSGHGVGKTFLAACALVWFLLTHENSIVISTAPTGRQVKYILWKEVSKLYNKAKKKIDPVGELLTTEWRISKEWFALGFSTDDPNAFQGQHGTNLFAIFDEACGIPNSIFESAEGILTSSENKALLIGNPTEPGTFFHKTHTGDEPGYERMRISCFDSPNITLDENGQYVDLDPLPYPALTSMVWINRMRKSKGEGSNFWKSRVLGEFPETASDQLIDGKDIALAMHRGILLRKLLKKVQAEERVMSSEEVAKIMGRS